MPRKNIDAELFELCSPILKSNMPDVIYTQIAKNACKLLAASASMLILLNDKQKEYWRAGTHNLSVGYLKNTESDIAISKAACKEGRTRFIRNTKEERMQHDQNGYDHMHQEGIASLIAIPLSIDKTVIGCLNIYYKRAQKSVRMRESFELFLQAAALAIVHARSVERLNDITQIMNGMQKMGMLLASSIRPNEMSKQILSTAVNITNADTGSLLLIDEKNKTILNAYEYKKLTKKMREYESTARLEGGISGEILRTKQAITISNLSAYNNVNPVALKKKRISIVGIPLITRERVIGILFLDSFVPRVFTQTEIDHLTLLCSQAATAIDNTLLYETVQRETKETALLYEVSQSLISTLDFDQLLNNILQHLQETFEFLNVSVLLVDEEKQSLYTHSSITHSPGDETLRLRIGRDGITGHVAKTKAMYCCPDVREDTYYVAGNEKTRSEACFPLLIGERLIGVLDVESSKVNGFSQDTLRLLSSLSAQIAIAIDNARLYVETKKLSLTDPLTLLSNRRSFDIFIDAEIKRAERYRRTFVVMMIDFDNFKNYNDKYGHNAGDVVLQKLSKIMKDIIRDVDFLCRYGGDEFVSILPETDASFALDIAERMRKKIAAQRIQPKITLSIGIASFPHDARDKAKLIDLADQACYEAKQRGGNRVLFTFKPKEDR